MLAPQRVSSKGRPPRAQGATLLGAGAHCCPGEQGRLGDAHALSCTCVPSSQRVSPGPEIKDWATRSLRRRRSWMNSRTLAGVGADRRELAAVTRRDHERAAATEAVGHGRNRPGAGREPRGLTAAAAPPAQAALGGPGPGRSGSELSRHQQNHSAARAPCGPSHTALSVSGDGGDGRTSRRQGAALPSLTVTHPHTLGARRKAQLHVP